MKLKKIVSISLITMLLISLITGCSKYESSKVLNIYNIGDYIEPGLIEKFEKQTGIKVVYESYDTNEAMYQKLKSESSNYDLVFPSDYMVEKLISEGMLQEIDYSNIPNYKYIMDDFKNYDYDKGNRYSVPYLWGTFGILYNKTMVDKKDVYSWDVLWNSKYQGKIQMLDSVRDTMGISLMRLGYSMNTKNEKEIEEAKEELIKQLPIVQAYVNDDGVDRMISGDAILGVYYSGDASVMMNENENLQYSIPKEGSNKWIDTMCIPKIAENKDYAEKFINFMLDPENALLNVKYIDYSTPNKKVYEMLDEDIKSNDLYYPNETVSNKLNIFNNLPKDIMKLYNDAWTEIKSQ